MKRPWLVAPLVAFGLILGLAVWEISAFAQLRSLRLEMDRHWKRIEDALPAQGDLVLALIETLEKRWADRQASLPTSRLELNLDALRAKLLVLQLANARLGLATARSREDRVFAATAMDSAVAEIARLAGRHLRAENDERIGQLWASLDTKERWGYRATVREYNELLKRFPVGPLAGVLGWKEAADLRRP